MKWKSGDWFGVSGGNGPHCLSTDHGEALVVQSEAVVPLLTGDAAAPGRRSHTGASRLHTKPFLLVCFGLSFPSAAWTGYLSCLVLACSS